MAYAVALYAGLRRQEIQRLRWDDLDLEKNWLTVQKSKSEAGTGRRVPLAQPLKQILLASAQRHGSAPHAHVVSVSVMSGKLAERATAAWTEAGLRRITLHECRRTFASMLMAAGYTIKEIMVFMGHADLETVQRYVKLLPQRDERNPVERLDSYLRGRLPSRPTSQRGWRARSGHRSGHDRQPTRSRGHKRPRNHAGGGTRTPDTRIMIPFSGRRKRNYLQIGAFISLGNTAEYPVSGYFWANSRYIRGSFRLTSKAANGPGWLGVGCDRAIG